MIVADNTFLTLLFYSDAKAPNDPKTGEPIDRLAERIDDLVARWRTNRDRILIPTPALSEFLFLAENDGPAYLAEIDSDPLFRVRGFDQKAAIELAALNLQIKNKLSKNEQKKRDKQGTKVKVSFDKQIVAIAIANGVRHIYSDDKGVANFAGEVGINVVRTWDLPAPKMKQMALLDRKETTTDEADNEES